MVTTIERLAAWVADLRLDDVPDAVVDLCRAQRRSVFAAVAASTGDVASRRVLAGVETWAGDGPVLVPGLPRSVAVDAALYAAAALSIALDFDDYVCFAHAGHSAVLVPVVLAAETGASAAEQLTAQIAANELEARLGGACLLGPLNGQLWSFVHAAGSAVAAGRLLGLDTGRLAHALALALYQAPRATVPGFMAPDSKLLTAAEPTLAGMRAARLAARGVTGPLDALDHPQGFFDAFCYAPLPALLGGLGSGWATRTMSIKRYPGCAYVDTTVDALLELGPPPAADVASVVVEAGGLTGGMDAMSHGDTAVRMPTPVTINFSIPWTVAVTLVAGRLTPVEVNEEWLATHHRELAEVADRVSVRHDWSLTLRTAEAMAPLLPVRAITAGTPTRRLLAAVRRTRRGHKGIRVGVGDGMAVLRALRARGIGAAGRAATGPPWAPAALDAFTMTFPARVRVRLRDGRELVAERDIPHGGAGNMRTSPDEVSREKLSACGPAVWDSRGTENIVEAIDSDAAGLWRLLGTKAEN
ncbi:MmgE/PrpD family protein [Mycobacterium persicum]|uniref:MmgE/PrpD family protein n=1 Tax=Mycobacterium persicum TaxID=1487726 RepID=UPI001C6117A5|nr:MmgE/PrpD family protein [Mycobacterium persicum]